MDRDDLSSDSSLMGSRFEVLRRTKPALGVVGVGVGEGLLSSVLR